MSNVNHRPLSELCESTIASVNPKRQPESEFWYVDISAADNTLKQIVSPQKVNGKLASVRARQVIRTNDVLVATTRPNLNAVALVPEQYDGEVCSTGFCVLRVGSELDSEYLYYFVQSAAFVNPLTDLTKGALYPAVSELAPHGTCAIVLDEGLLFRTNESAFVDTKRKLVDECDLWAIISLPGGVFSTAGAGVKTNLLFFTKGKKTEKIWYYNLSYVKVGKKTPLTLAHFGFDQNGAVLADAQLPGILTKEWLADEGNAGKPFPSYARMLASRGTAESTGRYSWTVDFAARRAKARAEMQPLLDEATVVRATVIDLKEQLKRQKKAKASDTEVSAIEAKIREGEKTAHDLETEASGIDAAVFDLKAVNPTVVANTDVRTPLEIIGNIESNGMIVSKALQALSKLMSSAN